MLALNDAREGRPMNVDPVNQHTGQQHHSAPVTPPSTLAERAAPAERR
jgi:hypothetical protein